MNCANPPKEPYKKGVPASEQPLPEPTQQFVEVVFPILFQSIKTDDDKPTVATALDSLSESIELLGPASIEKCIHGEKSLIYFFLKLKKKTFLFEI